MMHPSVHVQPQRLRHHALSFRSALAVGVIASTLGCVDNGKPADQPQGFNVQEGYPAPQEPPPPPPAQTAQTQNPQAPPPSQQSAQKSAAAPTTASSPLPGVAVDPALLGQIGSASLAILTPGGVAGDPIEAGIKATATRSAPNMQPEGQMAKDTLQENAHKEMLVTLTGGKCYTIIGFSPAGQIRNLDLRLLSPPFYNVQAGQDDTADGTPIIGKGGMPICPITPFPLQYKLDIHSQKGSGPFGVQVLSRMK